MTVNYDELLDQLPSIEDRGQTDRVTNHDRHFQSPASYGHS